MTDRELLERHAPLLRYDAQDAYRVVAASTFTDNPPNRLRRRRGQVVAKPPRLSLDSLPGFDQQPGDHLVAGPDLLADAVRMQADTDRHPHGAYGRVLRDDDRTWLQYWLWYYDNPKTFLGKGRHQGDWELVQIGLDADDRPEWVTCSQHGLGETRPRAGVTWHEAEPDRPVVHVAPFSHANYFEPGTRFYFPAADHPTDQGPSAVPEVLDFGPWQAWRGRWGPETGTVLLGVTIAKLGGVAPASPIVQRERWETPATFARKARRPTNSAVKSAIWSVGKATYPLAPEVEEARLVGRAAVVGYRLRQRPWRRIRHLLVTVHRDEPGQPMLASAVQRTAAGRGEAVVELPEDVERAIVWVSAFNRLGQRSDARTAPAG